MNIREEAAQYYDIQSFPIDDVPFYLSRIPAPDARILELGCGTGRVLVPLAKASGFTHGVDSSAAMLSRCRAKLEAEGLLRKSRITVANITDLDLGATFDLIVAPFRVMQNLETDEEIAGLMSVIRTHLAPGGTVILNAFRPSMSREEALRTWIRPKEQLDGETPMPGGGKLVRTHTRPRMRSEPLTGFPELIYRRYSATGDLVDEAVLKIAMRFWYPDDLEKLVTDYGFRITNRWGGYQGEAWGEGPELVIGFTE